MSRFTIYKLQDGETYIVQDVWRKATLFTGTECECKAYLKAFYDGLTYACQLL